MFDGNFFDEFDEYKLSFVCDLTINIYLFIHLICIAVSYITLVGLCISSTPHAFTLYSYYVTFTSYIIAS